MTTITQFTQAERAHNSSHRFAFTLTPTNYGYWKTMIEPFLQTNNLYGYVDGSLPPPNKIVTTPAGDNAATTVNPNYTAWVANDAHVRMILISTVSEASFAHVQGNTAYELWNSLARAYAPQTASREFSLKTQLLKLQMAGDETPLQYLSRAQEYASSLANIGEQVKDKDLVLFAISGLREEYNGLKSTLLARSSPILFNELFGLLNDHDYMVTKPPSHASPATFIGTTSQSPHQLLHLQQMASNLGYQLTPNTNTPQHMVQPTPQANYSSQRPNYSRGNNARGRNRNNRGGNRGRERVVNRDNQFS